MSHGFSDDEIKHDRRNLASYSLCLQTSALWVCVTFSVILVGPSPSCTAVREKSPCLPVNQSWTHCQKVLCECTLHTTEPPHNLNLRCAWLQGMPGKDGRDGAPGLDGEKVCKVLLKHCRKDFCYCPMCAAKPMMLLKKEHGWKAFTSKVFQ